MTHVKVYSLVLLVLLALFVAMVLHGRGAGHGQDELRNLKSVSPLLPSGDVGADNSARYVRHLTLSTPGSAFPDYPGQSDYLPAGMTWAPPLPFLGLIDKMSISAPERSAEKKSP